MSKGLSQHFAMPLREAQNGPGAGTQVADSVQCQVVSGQFVRVHRFLVWHFGSAGLCGQAVPGVWCSVRWDHNESDMVCSLYVAAQCQNFACPCDVLAGVSFLYATCSHRLHTREC